MKVIKYDPRFSASVKMDHGFFGRPYAGGTVRSFFVPSVHFGREIVELLQRADIDHENVTIDRMSGLNMWGFGDYYSERPPVSQDFTLQRANLEAVLCSDEQFDVLIFPPFMGWDQVGNKTLEAIKRRVCGGAGLILSQPFVAENDSVFLQELSPLIPRYRFPKSNTEERLEIVDLLLPPEAWEPAGHFITAGVPFGVFPYDAIGCLPYEAPGEVILRTASGAPVAAVGQYGKGRVLALGYYARDVLPQHREFTGWDPCYEPAVENWHGGFQPLPFRWLEYFYSLINRGIVWAAGRESPDLISSLSLRGDTLHVEADLRGPDTTGFFAEVTVRNFYDTVVYENTYPLAPAGSPSVEASLPGWLRMGGSFRADIRLLKGGVAADWATLPFNYAPDAGVKSVSVSEDVLKPGDTLSGRVEAFGAVGEIEAQVVDDFDRVLHRQIHPVSDGEVAVSYPVTSVPSMHLRIVALFRLGGRVLQKEYSRPVIVTLQDRDFHDFEVFICPQNRGHGDLLPLQNCLLREAGSTGLFTGDNRMSTLSGIEGIGLSWWEREPYIQRKEQYLASKDKKDLQRISCFNDPAFWDQNERRIEETVSKNARFGPVSYFANDEGSVTCYADELELCFCPHCMAGMRDWLHEVYASLDELNASWGTAFHSWDDVVPHTTEEAKKTGEYASWGDHRMFMERSFAGLYARMRDRIRKIDPLGKVRMSGTQKPTAYSGYDYWLLHQAIGYFEAYGVGDQFEIHRSYANPGTVIGRWCGYGVSGANARFQAWQAICHRLTLISIFWEYSVLNPDFSFSRSAVDYGEAFREIRREGIGKLLLYASVRDNLGIAVHHSMASIHGSYILGAPDRFEDNRHGWITALEDLGYQYDFLSSQQIEGGDLARRGFRLLILPYSVALGDKEADEIREFVRNGGTLLADFQTGLMDMHCKHRDTGCLDDVFGIRRVHADTTPFFLYDELDRNADNGLFTTDHAGSSELRAVESGTRLSTGVCGYTNSFSNRIPAAVHHAFGSGRAFYLNFGLDRYCAGKKIGEGGKARAVVREALVASGIHKPASLHWPDGSPVEAAYESVYYRSGSVEYLAFLRELGGGSKAGADGILHDHAGSGEIAAEELTVQLGKPGHIYDVRTGRYLGFGCTAPIGIAPGDTALLSVLPYEVVSVSMEAEGSFIGGETLVLTFHVEINPFGDSHTGVLSVSFYNPDGGYEGLYSANLILDGGRADMRLIIPYNMQAGTWRIRAKDVASGVCADKRMKLGDGGRGVKADSI